MKRFITAMLCVVMALCMFGCGQSNEEKYTTLKNEVRVSAKAIANDVFKDVAVNARIENIPVFERNLKKAYEDKKVIDDKLKEMEKLAQKDLKLSNDLQNFKEELREPLYKITIIEAALKEQKIMFNVK